ncbi:methyltransferase domain-containing protein [Brevibacillus sp. H7]|uniref:methyltransferase domain-containing protein n=1 Tax=Brevibacillus sp. H7 TaxID=3349138 RepID=UPI0037FE2435
MKLLDKVAEAYYGQMGDRFARKTRERIHWICSKVQGKHVLDIGCSQGITEILLAREGKQVVGIDIEEEAIIYAKNAIMNESDTVKRNVEYRGCSIFEFESEQKFETVILAEVLEHFSSSTSLLERVSNLLTDDGTLIVTVPFGINDFIDHKKTYYLFNLLEEVEPFFEPTEVKFFGKWLGLVARKNTRKHEGRSLFSREIVKQLEDGFYTLERALVDDVEAKTQQIRNLNTQLTEMRSNFDQLKQENVQLKRENENLKTRYDEIKARYNKLEQDYDETSARYNKLEQDYDEVLARYNKLEQDYDETSARYNKLEQDYDETSARYNKLEQDYDETSARYNKLEQDYDETSARYNKLEQDYDETSARYNKLEQDYDELTARYKKLERDNAHLTATEHEIATYKQKIAELEKTIDSKNKEILKRLDSEENTLKQYKDAIFEYNQLEAKYANVSKKYNLLSKAKLGRLTLAYWKFRKRIPEDF